MVSGPGDIGRQLKKLRTERGYSQAELAERAGVSPDLVAKLEQGSRQSARLTSLTRLATALDVEMSELLEQRPRIDRGSDAGTLLAVRDVLLTAALLPGIDARQDDGQATPTRDLYQAVRVGWEHYFAGRFGRLAAVLPDLIGEARVTRQAAGPDAAGPLAQAYQLAACLMVHTGKHDVAAIAAERAVTAAREGNDELQWATLNGTYSWVLLYQGRLAEAETHAASVAQRIEPSLSRAPAAHLTVWGGLLLTALASAAAAHREAEVGDYISLARAGAARFEHDRHDYWVSFGPTQVAAQATHAHTQLGNHSRALQAARNVRSDQLLRISHARHLIDIAQALLDGKRDEQATTTLREAHELSPEWFRHQGVARSIVAHLVRRRQRLTPTLRALAQAVELR